MRRAVLTSSDVSVLASMAIVILCTLALFLSGYAIQQRTLRDLRLAIRPRESRPSPQAHLPDRFRTTTTELEDGTVVFLESEADREAKEMKRMADDAAQTPPSRDGDDEEQQDAPAPQDGSGGVSKRQLAIIEQLKAQVAAKSWGVEHPDPLSKSRIPVTRAERRRLIKEEIRRLAQADEPVYYQRRLW
ncbi:Uncharacterized protein TCAP_02580 [Tolypocladium capitatum]|uniref:Transmembrane protein n=1 Tax=Tolypocladium capitatum TaxID=45235 RepID=A0A2K3QIY3_9HYPO|nr:Uncharacterized protein TCAP_02580 [Tolypocladium capitatum]